MNTLLHHQKLNLFELYESLPDGSPYKVDLGQMLELLDRFDKDISEDLTVDDLISSLIPLQGDLPLRIWDHDGDRWDWSIDELEDVIDLNMGEC